MTTLGEGLPLPEPDPTNVAKTFVEPKVVTSGPSQIRASTTPLPSGKLSQVWKAFSKMISLKEPGQTTLLTNLYEIQRRCNRKIAECEADVKLDFAVLDSKEPPQLEILQQNTRVAERMLEKRVAALKKEVTVLQGMPSTEGYRALSSKNQQKVDTVIRASTEKANGALRDCENRRHQLDLRNGHEALCEFLNNQSSIIDEETEELVKAGPDIDPTILESFEKMVHPQQVDSPLSLQELALAKEALLKLKNYYAAQANLNKGPAVEGQLKSLIKGIKEIERQQETCFLRELDRSSPEIKKVFTDLKELIGTGAAIPIDQKMAIMAILKLNGFNGIAKFNEYLQCAGDIKRDRAELLMQHATLKDDDRLSRKYIELFQTLTEYVGEQLSPDDARTFFDFHRFATAKAGAAVGTLYQQFGEGRDCHIEGPYLAAGEKRLVERGYRLHENYGMWMKESWEPSSDIDLPSPLVAAWNGEFALKREDGAFGLRQRRHIFDLSRFGLLTKEQKLLAIEFASQWCSVGALAHAALKEAIGRSDVSLIPENYRSLLIAPDEDFDDLRSQMPEKILERYKALVEATENFAGQVSRSIVSSVMETPLSSLQGTPLFATYNLAKSGDYLNISGAYGVVPLADSIYKAILGEKEIAEDPDQPPLEQLRKSGMSKAEIDEISKSVKEMQKAEDEAF